MRTIRSGLSASQLTCATLHNINRLVIGEKPHAAFTGEHASARRQRLISTQRGMPDNVVAKRLSTFIGVELGRNGLRNLTVNKPPPTL
jgi:hypothetical protein